MSNNMSTTSYEEYTGSLVQTAGHTVYTHTTTVPPQNDSLNKSRFRAEHVNSLWRAFDTLKDNLDSKSAMFNLHSNSTVSHNDTEISPAWRSNTTQNGILLSTLQNEQNTPTSLSDSTGDYIDKSNTTYISNSMTNTTASNSTVYSDDILESQWESIPDQDLGNIWYFDSDSSVTSDVRLGGNLTTTDVPGVATPSSFEPQSLIYVSAIVLFYGGVLMVLLYMQLRRRFSGDYNYSEDDHYALLINRDELERRDILLRQKTNVLRICNVQQGHLLDKLPEQTV